MRSLRFLSASAVFALCFLFPQDFVSASPAHHHRRHHSRPLEIHVNPDFSSSPRHSHSHHKQIDVSNVAEALGYLVAHASEGEKAELHLSATAIEELKREKEEEEAHRESSIRAEELSEEEEEEEEEEERAMEAGEGLINSEEVEIESDDFDSVDLADVSMMGKSTPKPKRTNTIKIEKPVVKATTKVPKCSEYDLRTNGEVKDALVGDCKNPTQFLVKKSAHNCEHKLYQCNGNCMKIKEAKAANLETGVCVN